MSACVGGCVSFSFSGWGVDDFYPKIGICIYIYDPMAQISFFISK